MYEPNKYFNVVKISYFMRHISIIAFCFSVRLLKFCRSLPAKSDYKVSHRSSNEMSPLCSAHISSLGFNLGKVLPLPAVKLHVLTVELLVR